MGRTQTEGKPVDHNLYNSGGPGPVINVRGWSNVSQEEYADWELYQDQPDFVNEFPPVRVCLDDWNVYMAISHVGHTERAVNWPADFDNSGNIRLVRANYGQPALMGDGKDERYAIFRGVYQLCGEEGRDQVKTRVGKEKSTFKEVFKPGNKRVPPKRPQPAQPNTPKAKTTKTKKTPTTAKAPKSPSPVAGPSKAITIPSSPSAPNSQDGDTSPAANTLDKPTLTPSNPSRAASPATCQFIVPPGPSGFTPNTCLSQTADRYVPPNARVFLKEPPSNTPAKRTADQAGLETPTRSGKDCLMALFAKDMSPAPEPGNVQPLPVGGSPTKSYMDALRNLVPYLMDTTGLLTARLDAEQAAQRERTETFTTMTEELRTIANTVEAHTHHAQRLDTHITEMRKVVMELADIPDHVINRLRLDGENANADELAALQSGWKPNEFLEEQLARKAAFDAGKAKRDEGKGKGVDRGEVAE